MVAQIPPRLRSLALYTALVVGANAAAAAGLTDAQRAEIADLRAGEMRKLVVHEEARPAPGTAFTGADGSEATLADSNGKIRLVNFWATWCAPCRREKPALDALQRDLGGDDFTVIAVATGRNSPDAIARFNADVGVTTLDTHLDPKSALAAAMKIPGLPVTVVLDRDGDEIGRLMGGVDWDSDSARAIVRRLIEVTAPPES